MSWVSCPCKDSVWVGQTDSACLPRASGGVWKSSGLQTGSVALLLPARPHRHRELLFGHMFSCCRVPEPGRTMLLLLGCCLAQHPAFLWANPSLSQPRGARRGGDGEPIASLAQGLVCSLRHFLLVCSQGKGSRNQLGQARICKIDGSKVLVSSCGGGRQAWLCSWCHLLLSPGDRQPGAPGSVTAAACRDGLNRGKNGPVTLFT